MKIQASYYQQFDADLSLDVPGEGYGGWQKSEIEISREHTAVVVMHTWEFGSAQDYPGWHRCVEFIPRAQRICREVLPRILAAARGAKFKIFHVAGGSDYYKKYPGYRFTESISDPEPTMDYVASDPVMQRLHQFRGQRVFVGRHNEEDVNRGFAKLDFPAETRPLDHEPIAATSRQLFSLCRREGVNHLIYTGFAIDGCVLISPGGMIDMCRHGVMCSTIRQATTAIENKETARHELAKEIALWRVGLLYGFVFDVDDFIAAL